MEPWDYHILWQVEDDGDNDDEDNDDDDNIDDDDGDEDVESMKEGRMQIVGEFSSRVTPESPHFWSSTQLNCSQLQKCTNAKNCTNSMQGLFDRVCVIMSAEKDICNSHLNELNTSDGTLLWDNRRLIGRSLIVLARQVQNNRN